MTIFPELADDRAAGRLKTTLPEGATLDSVTWGMLTHNEIPGVAAVRRTQLDDRVELSFAAPGESLASRMDTPLTKDQVLALLDGMVEAVLAAGRHMIPTSALLYDPERVFVTADGAVTMICVPLDGSDHGDPVGFFKRVIFNLRYAPQDDTSYVSDLINVLGSSAAGDVSRLSRLLRATRVSEAAGRGATSSTQAPQQAPGGASPVVQTVGESAPLPEWGAPESASGAAPRAAGPGFAVPGGATVPAGQPVPAARAAATLEPEDEDHVSLAYLLQHYSKENKERYDRGRRARAAAKAAARAAAAETAGAVPAIATSAAAAAPPAPAAPSAPAALPAPPGALAGHAGGPVHPQGAGAVAAAPPAGVPTPEHAVPEETPLGYPRHAEPSAGQPAVQRFGLQDLSTGATVWLTKPITVVGRRRARVDIAVAGDTVSKKHAIVQVDGDTCSIIDNASTNGVEIDGVRIAPMEAVVLQPGARVGVGDVVLMLVDRAAW